MPRFDRGVVNTKLEKGDIVLMGNPTQYGEILAENILIEDILKADLETLISGSNLVRGKFYRITNAVSSTLSLLVQGLTANTICDYAYNTANGDLVTYNISTDLAGVPFSSVYVPYTGATADVNLGEYQIRVGQLELDQTPTGTFGVGKIRWNDTDGTPEVMLKGANVTLQIGQEQLARVVNKTNTNLTEAGYQVVRISGAQGQRLKVGLAQANSTSTCKDTLGLVTENINNNAEGFITTSGLVRNINTTGSLQGETWADGDRIYLSSSVAGGITNVEPSAPNIVIVLGYVVYAHANQGSIYVSVEGAKALHELFDVSIPTPTNNNVLVYESSTGLWKDKSISTILGFTPIANNATVGGELSGTLPNPSLVTSAVTGKALTGLSVSGSAVVSTDSILTGIGKLQNQINAVVGSVNFQGVWNASTNSPSLASGVGTKGYYYVVSVAGSTNLDGITDWKLGDWAIYDGSAWQKVDNTDAVVSVNGYTGIVTLAKADIGLGNVENTALSTWAGSTNITTVGTITTGVIGDSVITSASTWNAKIGGSGTSGIFPIFNGTGTITDSSLIKSTNTIIAGNTTTGNNIRVVSHSYGNTGLVELYGTDNALKLQFGTSSASEAYIFANTGIDLNIYAGGASRAVYTSDGQYITNGATDTGEAHIFGGSARVNGNMYVIGGNVVIGGTTGSVALNVLDSANTFSAHFSGLSQTNGVAIGTDSSNNALIQGYTKTFSATNNISLQAAGGNVGIGTTSPNAKLHVQNGATANTLMQIHSFGSESAGEYAGIQFKSAASSANEYTKSLLAFRNNGSGYGRGDLYFCLNDATTSANASLSDVKAVITSAGNVGIGTTSPAYKLDINGTLGVTGAATFSSSVTATKATFTALPTSASGLSAGDIWNDSGTLKIV